MTSLLLLTITTSIIGAINPCTMSVFTMSISSLLGKNKHPRHAGIHSLLFALGVGTTYAVIGSAMMVLLLNTSVGFLGHLATFVALILIVMGLIEIKDFFWYGRWITFKISKNHETAIHRWTKRHHSLLRGYLLGIYIAFAQAHYMMALQVGFILIILLSGVSALYLPWLWALVYITPLLSLSQLILYGVSVYSIASWKDSTRNIMRLGIGILFIIVAWTLILLASGGIALV